MEIHKITNDILKHGIFEFKIFADVNHPIIYIMLNLTFLGFESKLDFYSDLPNFFDVSNKEKVKEYSAEKFLREYILSYKDSDREKCPFYTEYLKFLRTRKINNILSEDIR